MAYPAKFPYAVGAMAKEEASLGSGGSLSTSTDGQKLALQSGRGIPLVYKEDYDGVQSYDLAARSPLALLPPSTRSIEGLELPFSWKGNSSALSGSVVPALRPFLKASGLQFSFASSKWTGIPWDGSAAPTSIFGSLYTGSEKFPFTHGLAAWRFMAEKGGPIIDTFRLWGLLGDPSDDLGGVEALSIAYPSPTLDQPRAESMTIQIGDYLLPVIRKVEFELGWEDPSLRENLTLAGYHGGWVRGMTLKPRLKLTVEKTALVNTPFHTSAGLDAYKLRKNVTKLTGSTVRVLRGSVTNNKQEVIFPAAQLTAPVVQEDNGGISSVTIEIGPYASTPTANDAFILEET